MHKYLLTIVLGLGLTALGGHLLVARPVAAQTNPRLISRAWCLTLMVQ